MTAPDASVLIPTRNPGPGIASVLDAVFGQDAGFAFEVVIVDSDSVAPDIDLMRSYQTRVHSIRLGEFGHGRTRNLLASLARGRWLLYLSQDAEPADSTWMRTLLAPLDDPAVAGCYAQQVPRPNADP